MALIPPNPDILDTQKKYSIEKNCAKVVNCIFTKNTRTGDMIWGKTKQIGNID